MGDTAIKGITKLTALGNVAIKMSGKPLPYKTIEKRPDENNMIGYERYLVDQIGCYHCHSKSILSFDYLQPEKSKGYMAGGMKWKIDGEKIYASNLTPDIQTGIEKFTKEDFRRAIQDGIGLNEQQLRATMPEFKHLTNRQSDAIFAYLETLTPKQHENMTRPKKAIQNCIAFNHYQNQTVAYFLPRSTEACPIDVSV